MPKTLAERHQHYMCYLMMEPSTYMKTQMSYAGGKLSVSNQHDCDCVKALCSFIAKSVVVRDLDRETELQLAAGELKEDTVVFR